jgi:hypothetical protein
LTLDATAPVTPDVSIEVDEVNEVHTRARDRRGDRAPLTDEPWRVRRFFVPIRTGASANTMRHLEVAH